MGSDDAAVWADLRQRRDRAATEVATLDRDLHALFEASRTSNADDEHDPEGATIAFERAQLTAVRDAARRRLADLDLALQRVADGTYGVCEVCGQAIPADRLSARPAARTCVGCAGRGSRR
jgi:RNA polymerase-binding transcription factor DksA